MTDGNYRGLGIASLILKHLVHIARRLECSASRLRCLPKTPPCLPSSAGAGCPCNAVVTAASFTLRFHSGTEEEQRHGT